MHCKRKVCKPNLFSNNTFYCDFVNCVSFHCLPYVLNIYFLSKQDGKNIALRKNVCFEETHYALETRSCNGLIIQQTKKSARLVYEIHNPRQQVQQFTNKCSLCLHQLRNVMQAYWEKKIETSVMVGWA